MRELLITLEEDELGAVAQLEGCPRAVIALPFGHCQTQAERYEAVSWLLAERYVDESEADRLLAIKEWCGLSKAQVEAILRFGQIIPELRDALADGRIAEGLSKELQNLPERFQRTLLPILEEHGKLTGEDIRQVRMVKAQQAADALPAALFTHDKPDPVAYRYQDDPAYRAAWDKYPELVLHCKYDLEALLEVAFVEARV